MVFYTSYIGGKSSEIKYFKEDLYSLIDSGKITRIIEPFCGSCAVSYHLFEKYGSDKLEFHLNDIDSDLMRLLQEVKEKGSKHIIEWVNEQCKDLTRERFKEIISGSDVNSYVFKRKVHGLRYGMFPASNRKYGDYDPKRYELLDKFFMSPNTHLYEGDYADIFERFKNDDKALIFIDPPYLDSFNAYYYSHKGKATEGNDNEIKDMTKVYADIVNLLKCPCKVLSVQNANGLLRHLYKDYIKLEYDKLYNFTRKRTKHMIISNY
jgi:site-specific DNA-adenine methylase